MDLDAGTGVSGSVPILRKSSGRRAEMTSPEESNQVKKKAGLWEQLKMVFPLGSELQ